jgi:hypothetical protein
MAEWTNNVTGPTGSYTDESGTHELTIINDHPSVLFEFDGPRFDPDHFEVVAVTFDGCTADNCPMSMYQDIIDFCKNRIEVIPHYEVSDGKLEWKEERHED